MKKLKISFLFFYSIVLCLVLCTNVAYSQEKKDSTYYYYYKIKNPKQNSDLSSGYTFYHQHKIKALLKQDTLRAIYDLRMIAESQKKMGLYRESVGAAIEAIQLLDNLKHKDTLIRARYGLLNHLGVVYRNSYDYDKAIEVYQKALKITDNQKDSITIINNIGNIYFDLKEYDLAMDQFELIYTKTLNHSNPLQKARVLNNLGAIQSKLDLPDALKNLNTSLAIRKKEKKSIDTYQTYKNLFHYYNDRNEKRKAQLFADSAYNVIIKTNNKSFIQDALALHTTLSKDSKIIEYKRLTDSIHKAEQFIRNEYSFNKYRYDKQEKIAQENKLQEEIEKSLKTRYQALAAFILLLLIFSYFIFKARNKKEKLEQIYITETRISKKIHDEVANDVYQIMTKLQSSTGDTDEILDDIEEIYHKTRDISKENAAIDMDEGFAEMLNQLLVGYKNDEIAVITKNLSKINWDKTTSTKKTTMYRVLQELMTNMRKHSKASIVILTFSQEKNKIHIKYQDNGMGCELKKQVGLQNVENRIASINGSINFDTEINKGFKVNMTI